VADYFSATAGTYILGLSAWAALGAVYVMGGPFGWALACLLALGSLLLTARALRDGEAAVPTLAAPVLSAVALLYFTVPRGMLVVLLLGFVGWWLLVRFPAVAGRGELPISATTAAYLLGACAWGLVGLYFLLIDSEDQSSQGCGGFVCLEGLGDEIYWFTVLAPPFFLLSLAGVAVAAGALWRYGWSTMNFGALALAGSGPAIYAWLAHAYG
jgi:hypothetical protein